MWCRDKLIHWLPDSDIIELADNLQLVNNFTVYETSSQLAVNKVTHSKTFLSHNVLLHSSSHRTLKFTFNQTLISIFLHSVSSPWTKHFTNRKQPLFKGLWGSCCQQINSRNWELAVCFLTTIKPEFQRLVFHHQTGLNISNVFVDYPYRCGWRGRISWLVVSAF